MCNKHFIDQETIIAYQNIKKAAPVGDKQMDLANTNKNAVKRNHCCLDGSLLHTRTALFFFKHFLSEDFHVSKMDCLAWLYKQSLKYNCRNLSLQ